MIRDKEIKKLKKYAEVLGTKVVFKCNKTSDLAAWAIDGSCIEIYKKAVISKTQLILSLIHEIGHHLWFIYEKKRKLDKFFKTALIAQNNYENNLRKNPPPKKMRKKIYEVEKNSTKYWEKIYNEINIKIPYWKLIMNKKYDLWIYETYYRTGFFPNYIKRKKKKKLLLQKFKKRKFYG